MYHYWGKKYIVTLHKTTQGTQRFPLFTEAETQDLLWYPPNAWPEGLNP